MTRKSELRDEIFELQQQVRQLMGTNGTLESWRTAWLANFDNEADKVSLQSVTSAWTQLLEMLGAQHQTEAVMKLRDLIGEANQSPTKLELIQQKATAESNIRIHQLAIRQLEFQRDSAQKTAHDQGFELDNTKARCEELEELLLDIRKARGYGELDLTITDRIDAMIGEPK